VTVDTDGAGLLRALSAALLAELQVGADLVRVLACCTGAATQPAARHSCRR
jgi:hypothetical protein